VNEEGQDEKLMRMRELRRKGEGWRGEKSHAFFNTTPFLHIHFRGGTRQESISVVERDSQMFQKPDLHTFCFLFILAVQYFLISSVMIVPKTFSC
jgi:hypothetical protein